MKQERSDSCDGAYATTACKEDDLRQEDVVLSADKVDCSRSCSILHEVMT